MQENNAFCSICGKGYVMCLSCKEYARLHPYQLHTDTAEHYKIYQVLHGYTAGIYSKDDARDKLLHIDLSDLNSFREDIIDRINVIMSSDEQVSTNILVVGNSRKKSITKSRTIKSMK